MSTHHLIITGTGRSGTSLLVRFLSACGLDSQLTRSGNVFWDNAANAGIENNLLLDSELPYVIKAPWHDMHISKAIAVRKITVDAVLVPMRDLVQAASSRLVLELRAKYEDRPELLDMPMVDSFGYVAGGNIYSMNPIDQAREAALGFHRLIFELVRHQIPVVFLEFPRFAIDFAYLYSQISQFLPPETSRQHVEEIFKNLVDQNALRLEKETNKHDDTDQESPRVYIGDKYPSLPELDNIALKRRVKELLKKQVETEARHAEMEARQAETEARRAEAEARLRAVYASRSWRMTKWLRSLRGKLV